AAVTYGAGAFNLVNPVASAYAEKSPVVVVSGGPGSADINTGLLIHHQAKHLKSQLEIYKEVTCDQAILDDPVRAPEQIARVLNRCVNESRPVYLEVPRDRVFADAEPVTVGPTPLSVDSDALEVCVAEIAGLLADASSPVLLVGIEVRRFGLEDAVAQLAQKLGVPVVTTFMGRGLLADANVALRGTYLGVAGDAAVTDLVEKSDALVMLGVITSDNNFGISQRQINLRSSILACDGAVSMGYHVYPDIPLKDLIPALESAVTARAATQRAEFPHPRGLTADDAAIEPLDIATAVNDLFEAHERMPVASDIGDCLFTALDFINTRLVAPGYYATMGFGVPAGLGVQAATGQRPLVVVGDGAFQMTGWELLNCGRYGWDPIVLVFNNRSWEMLRAFQPESKFNDLDELNFAEIAKTLGGDGCRVRTRRELRDALQVAHATRGRFQLVEIMLERGSLSPTLGRFVAGVERMRKVNA
ncbi:MAG: indolepyruvate/phenylpyruvate decarboxylase, partial [Gammaproteobacteria bacterium]|nr:indolepyruvate/phenylpyruvate decarboxylase [Gammaproteobacteria bacterium]